MRKEKRNQVITLKPTPMRNIRLSKAAHVRLEMARVYQECRNGLMDVSDGSRLVFMLAAIGKQISENDLEQRIEALEAQQEQSNNGKY